MAKHAEFRMFAGKTVTGRDYDGKPLSGKCVVTESRDLSGKKLLGYTFTVDGRSVDPTTLKSSTAVEKKDIPVDKELYARVKSEAKRKFDVYPSAYANGWLVQEYKRRGGKYRKVSRGVAGLAKHAEHDQSTHGKWAKGRSNASNPKMFKDRPLPKVGDRIGVHLDLNGIESGLGERVAFSIKMIRAKGKPNYVTTQAHTTGVLMSDIEVDVNLSRLKYAIKQKSKNPHSAFIGTVEEWLDTPREFILPKGSVEVDYWIDPKSKKYDETQTGVWYIKDGTYRVFKRASNGVGIGGVEGGDKARTYVWGDIELGDVNPYLKEWAESRKLDKAHAIAHRILIAKHARHNQKDHGNWARHSPGQVIGQLGMWTDEPYKRTAPEEYDSRAGKVKDSSPEPRHSLEDVNRDDDIAMEAAKDIFELEIERDDGTVIKVEVHNAIATSYGDIKVSGTVNVTEIDGSSRNVGKFDREINPDGSYVYNEYFSVLGVSGQGIGTTILRHWEDQLARHGIDIMRTSATSNYILNGAYTWAKYGYTPIEWGTVDRLLSEFIGDLEEEDLPGVASALTQFQPRGTTADEVYVALKDAYDQGGYIGWMAPEDEIGRSIVFSENMGEDILRAIVDIPGFADWLKSSGQWEGEKETSLLSKAATAHAEIMAICNKWMETDPAGLENDDPKFFEELRAVWAKHDKVNKHAEHNQDDHGSWAKGKPRRTRIKRKKRADSDYRMSHRPNEEGPIVVELTGPDSFAPPDIYKNPQWYTAFADEPAGKETIRVLRRLRGADPESLVSIYRAGPTSQVNNGDWVALSRAYAAEHAKHPTDPAKDMPIVEVKVPAKYVRWAGDDLVEWGYFGPDVRQLRGRKTTISRKVKKHAEHNQEDHGNWAKGKKSLIELDGETVSATAKQVIEAYELSDGGQDIRTTSGARVARLDSGEYVTLLENGGSTEIAVFSDLYELEGELDTDSYEAELLDGWRSEASRTIVYHGTGASNMASIQSDGLEPGNKTRGLRNRSIGSAVFTSPNEYLVESYTYDRSGRNSGYTIEIDLPRAIEDGAIKIESLDRESGFFRADALSSIAYSFDDYSYDAYSSYSGSGEDPETVVIYGSIPPEYLSVNGVPIQDMEFD